MRFPRLRGSTSNIVEIFVPDNTSTTGAGLTGLTSASTNLVIGFKRELDPAFTTYTGANIEAITTIGTFANPSSSSKVRIKAADATNSPGLYQLMFHDSATIFGAGDTSQSTVINMLETSTSALHIGPNMVLIPLVPYNPQDGVRMGLTALPNAAAGAVSGLPLSVDSSGRGDILKINGTSQTARDLGATLGVAGAGLTALGDARIANLDATISSRTKPADTQAAVTLVTTTTNLTNAPTAGDFTAAMKTSLNSATPTVTAGTVTDKSGYALTAGEHTNITADVDNALTAATVELAAIPSSTAGLKSIIQFIGQYFRFKRDTTSTTETMYKADSATSLGTSTVSDDGTTATHGKVS